MNLNQVTVPCLDLNESVAFYRTLGLKLIVYDAPKYARFECPLGGATFSVHLADAAALRSPAHEHGADPAAMHSEPIVYFEIENLDDRVRELEAAGLVFDSGPVTQEWLWREAYLRDPTGNLVCLYYAGSNRLNPPWRLRG